MLQSKARKKSVAYFSAFDFSPQKADPFAKPKEPLFSQPSDNDIEYLKRNLADQDNLKY